MGICSSSPKIITTNEKNIRNQEIEAALKREKQRISNEVKLLLLGAGESGKSTILKQMKVIHQNGFSNSEKQSYKLAIYTNVIEIGQTLVNERRSRSISYSNPSIDESLEQIILEASLLQPNLNKDLAQVIKQIYFDKSIQDLIEKHGNEFYLIESSTYYMNKIDLIGSDDYIPNDQDILHCRVKTTGITETVFKIGRLSYRMVDIGGQRSERKKWQNCFGNVTSIIFMVAISEYDQVLLEDNTANRMRESLALFSSIINYRLFSEIPIILFFNKIDIFEAKLARSPIEKHFPDYKGGPFYEAGCQYFKELFLTLDKSRKNRIYVHFTCATDTEQIKFVMEAVNDIFIQSNLVAAGLL